jgi:hypothetical protein
VKSVHYLGWDVVFGYCEKFGQGRKKLPRTIRFGFGKFWVENNLERETI